MCIIRTLQIVRESDSIKYRTLRVKSDSKNVCCSLHVLFT
jgi:hypothetical protein